MRRLTKSQLWIGLVLLTALLPSCSFAPSTATITGKVTIDGEAPNLEEFYVSFYGSDGKTAMGLVHADGSYTVKGVALGEARVCLAYYKADPTSEQEEAKRRTAPPPEESQAEPKTPEEAKALGEKLRRELLERDKQQSRDAQIKLPFAQRYADPQTSELAVTINQTRGQVFDINVTRE